MFHFQQLLEKNPSHYSALHKLIMLLKRAGKLSDAPRFIKLAERATPRAESDPGLKFCKVRARVPASVLCTSEITACRRPGRAHTLPTWARASSSLCLPFAQCGAIAV
jgi:hypothetical protein